jgi:protein-tyrosine phosphatase
MVPLWVETKAVRLAIMPRPRGEEWLSDEIKWFRESGVDVIVSALKADEVAELGLLLEAECCRDNGVEFISFPIEDRSVPDSITEFDEFVKNVQVHLSAGKAVLVHCRAGIGRSSLIAASLLLRNGFTATAAFTALAEARGCPVPDVPEQRYWVERYAEHCGFRNTSPSNP